MAKIAIIIIALIVAFAIYFEMRRGKEMARIADRLGFTFHAGQHRLPEALDRVGFDLFTQGPPNVKNRMEGERNGRRITLLDFTYEAHAAREGSRDVPVQDDHYLRETRVQSVVWIRSDVVLPDFDLSPSSSHLRQVAGRFDLTQVSFDGRPEFNRDFALLAREPESVRRLFTGRVIDYARKHPEMVVEARGRDTLFYRFRQLPGPDALPGFIAEAEGFLDAIE